MKKMLMAVVLIVALVSGVFAQAGKTNYYYFVESVKVNTGEKAYALKGDSNYYTFTNNSCYESDAKGNKKIISYRDSVYTYIGEQNNTYVYRLSWKSNNNDMYDTLIFSKDYKRLDVINSSPSYPDYKEYTHMYVQVDIATNTYLVSTTNLTSLPRPSSAELNKPPASSAQPSQSANVGNGGENCPVCNGTGGIIETVELFGGFKSSVRVTCWRCNGTGKKDIIGQPAPVIGGSSPSSSGSSSSSSSPSSPINDSSISSGTYVSNYQQRSSALSSAISRYMSATSQSERDRILSDIRSQQSSLAQFRNEARSKGVNISPSSEETWRP